MCRGWRDQTFVSDSPEHLLWPSCTFCFFMTLVTEVWSFLLGTAMSRKRKIMSEAGYIKNWGYSWNILAKTTVIISANYNGDVASIYQLTMWMNYGTLILIIKNNGTYNDFDKLHVSCLLCMTDTWVWLLAIVLNVENLINRYGLVATSPSVGALMGSLLLWF